LKERRRNVHYLIGDGIGERERERAAFIIKMRGGGGHKKTN